MRTSYDFKGQRVAVGEISTLPGCGQIGVFHSAFVLPAFRNNGIGKDAHLDRLKCASDALYDYALCSVQQNNSAQIQILESTGWKKLSEFTSRKTGHVVYLYGRNI